MAGLLVETPVVLCRHRREALTSETVSTRERQLSIERVPQPDFESAPALSSGGRQTNGKFWR